MAQTLDQTEFKQDKVEKKEYSLITQMEIFEEKTNRIFQEFYDSYLPRLVYYNNLIVKDKLIAEDIATDAFLKSLDKIEDYNPEKAGYSTWLFTISRNECIQYVNKHKRLTSIDKVLDTEGTTIKDFLKDDDVELSEIRDIDDLNITKGNIIKEKIKDLREPYKEVIRLRELENKSYRDITIILRKKDTISITEDFFLKNYNESTGELTLVDPEKKKKNELIKFYSIDTITDMNGNSVNFSVTEIDGNNLVSIIKLPKGEYNINGEIPFNMSTLKSQIRNGRSMIKNMVKNEFEKLDKIYL